MMIWNSVKSSLFRLDAERAHHFIMAMLKRSPQRFLKCLAQPCANHGATLNPSITTAVKVAGVTFSGRVGLAAGFDKNAEIITKLPSLGFSFGEVGTITPLPQAGNPKPRLFRLPEESALLNRFGFNNDGMEVIARRIELAKRNLPKDFRLGINIGKNKNTPNYKAIEDYVALTKTFAPLADYLVINISSPNTPGLRDLQTSSFISELISAVKMERDNVTNSSKGPPIFLKLAPEVSESDLVESIIPVAEMSGLQGWVLSNTLGTQYNGEPCGLSGAPLKALSINLLKIVRKHSRLPIISVGGIMTPEDAMERFILGADLVQIYTGWIYRGPRFPGEICRLTHTEQARYSKK